MKEKIYIIYFTTVLNPYYKNVQRKIENSLLNYKKLNRPDWNIKEQNLN